MSRRLEFLAVAAAAALVACSEEPTGVSGAPSVGSELVITQGAPVPAQAGRGLKPSFSDATAQADLGGSVSTALSLTPQSCPATASQNVIVTYRVSGRQDNPASFKVNTRWQFNGSTWAGDLPTTVNVAARASTPPPPPTSFMVNLNVVNASTTSSGTSSISIAPFDVSTSAPGALNVTNANVTLYVAFAPCAVGNTPPTLVLPDDITAEATSTSGAVVNFLVTATDLEDGDLTSQVSCDHNSGSTFPLGETTVNCSVTDTGGLQTTGSFKITVVDTTPAHFTSFPSGTITLIAADINGAILDIDALGIAVEDFGNVSEPSTFACDYDAGTVLEIGSTTTVSCTASDALGNESDPPSTFDVLVTLNVGGTGFLPPLRMADPYSVHKRGSTIPHKFLAPTYADGTPATDLAGDLRLVLNHLDGTVEGSDVEVNDYSAGSTVWRYDPDAGQYVFNLKTGTSSPWDAGTWKTTVSYKGIVLATTYFDLKR